MGVRNLLVEVREPGKPPRRAFLSESTDVGREGEGLLLEDPEVSRRHLSLVPVDSDWTLEDTGSTNGTQLNGVPVSGPVTISAGDLVQLGDSSLTIVSIGGKDDGRHARERPREAGGTADPGEPRTGAPSEARLAPQPRALDELESFQTDAAIIRYRPGSAGESFVRGYAQAVRRARKRLSGLGSEPWGNLPQICLVDPFPDPEHRGSILTEGTVVDAARGEIWIVATPEAPPEPPDRPLAMLFGASLPAAEEVRPLLEGYGLLLGGSRPPTEVLAGIDVPSPWTAEGEIAAAVALSFTGYLVELRGTKELLRLLSSAQPGRLDAAAEEIYGSGIVILEEAWRRKLQSGGGRVKPATFVRMALKYLRPHLRREVEMLGYMLLSLAFTMIFPFVTKRLLDEALPSRELSQVLSLLAFLGGALAISLLAGLRRAYVSAVVSGSIVRRIREEMFSRLQALSPAWFGRYQQGDVLSRFFSDVGRVEAGLSQVLREGFFQALSLIVSAGVLLKLNLTLGAMVLAGAPLIALIYRFMGAGARKRSTEVQEQLGGLLNVASENLSGQPVVKAFGLEAREAARFRRASERQFRSQLRLQLFGGLFGLSVQSVVTLLRLLVLGLGAYMILQGSLTVGGLVAFLGIMGEVLSPVATLTGIGQQLQESTGALVRINDILGSAPDIADAPGASPLPPLSREIRLAGVGLSYTSERRVLHAVECTIRYGSRVAFVGPSGAGKSSILQLLMRFYDPDEGAVFFDGRDIRQGTLKSLRAQMGVVFQDTFLFNTSLRENIRLGSTDASDAEVEAAAKAAELDEFIGTLPRGYDTPVGERGARLSGGQRQRLAIARALVRKPRVLLLDEATSALDPRTEGAICETLERLAEDLTIVSVTHRLTSISGYDRIFVVVDGSVAEEGSHADLVAAGGVYARLWAEQTGAGPPAEAPFDAAAALARVPLFSGLAPSQVAEAAARLRPLDLAAGEALSEGAGRLFLVRSGRARVLKPGLGGEPEPVAELGPGDPFGVAALLGNETGSTLQADGRLGLLVLDDESIQALSAAIPPLAAALGGRRRPGPSPAGGRRLSRMTMGPLPRTSVAGSPVAEHQGPSAEDLRRATGSLPAVRP